MHDLCDDAFDQAEAGSVICGLISDQFCLIGWNFKSSRKPENILSAFWLIRDMNFTGSQHSIKPGHEIYI